MIDWTYIEETTGQRLATSQSEDSLEAYEAAAKIAQRLANKNQVGVAFTAWLEDREGATAYRYPRKQGRPATGHPKTGAERIAKLRQERKQKGVCPCCGQTMKTSGNQGRRNKMTKFYISGGSDDFWMKTNAKTLTGAKAVASKTYKAAVGGKIEVAETEDHGEDGIRYIPVAVKYGYDNWQQA